MHLTELRPRGINQLVHVSNYLSNSISHSALFAGSRSIQVFDLVDDFEKLPRRLRAQIHLGAVLDFNGGDPGLMQCESS